jgi:plastocyanin
MRRHALPLLFVFALIVAACSSDDSSDAADPVDGDEPSEETANAPAPEPDPATVVTEPESAPAPEPTPTTPGFFADYEAEAAGLAQAVNDRDLPPEAPDAPIGAYGYSRYVFTQSGDDIIPALVEGPLGYQTRCQEEANDCSYLELKALYDSGAEIPASLGMDRATLGELVGQLDQVNVAINQYDNIGDACAAGFWKSTNQVANMGIHMIDPGANGFDPARPQMVLFAKDGGLGLGTGDIGNCVGGEWTGEEGYVPVGAVFNLALTEDHPEGFAGAIDNWHVHYNTCISRSDEVGASLVNDPESTGAAEGGSTSREACENRGGQFLPIIPNWMMHAYVAEDFDAQSGVFSMFNPTVWPLSSAGDLAEDRVVDVDADVTPAPILNFSFGEINVGVGETIRFNNSDAVPHTVTAGSYAEPGDAFDSGVLGTGQTFDLAFDEPGEYQLFCVLHPYMTATVVVE